MISDGKEMLKESCVQEERCEAREDKEREIGG